MEESEKISKYKIIKGDLIELAKQGYFEVIAHGCNCFCRMKSGIAIKMAEAFGCDKYPLEGLISFDKLGNNDGGISKDIKHKYTDRNLIVLNCYTQYNYGTDKVNLDYEALTLCLRKMNHDYKGLQIGLPKIGCGLAGGDWNIVQEIIKKELADCYVTIVEYEKA